MNSTRSSAAVTAFCRAVSAKDDSAALVFLANGSVNNSNRVCSPTSPSVSVSLLQFSVIQDREVVAKELVRLGADIDEVVSTEQLFHSEVGNNVDFTAAGVVICRGVVSSLRLVHELGANMSYVRRDSIDGFICGHC